MRLHEANHKLALIGGRVRNRGTPVACFRDGRDRQPAQFLVSIGGKTPGSDHRADIHASGNDIVRDQRLYAIVDRTLTIASHRLERRSSHHLGRRPGRMVLPPVQVPSPCCTSRRMARQPQAAAIAASPSWRGGIQLGELLVGERHGSAGDIFLGMGNPAGARDRSITGLRFSIQASAIWPGVAPFALASISTTPPGLARSPAASGNHGMKPIAFASFEHVLVGAIPSKTSRASWPTGRRAGGSWAAIGRPNDKD